MKWYVGSSIHIERRKATHLKQLRVGTHTGVKLLRAWKKYDPSVWEWQVLSVCDDPSREQLLEQEQFWIDKLDAFHNGYNALPKAGSCLGVKWTEERRKKTLTSRAKVGWAHSEETKKKIGNMQRGVAKGPMSDAQKQLLSKIKKEQGMPEVVRQRISTMAKGRVYTDAIRENMAKAHLGYIMPDEQKRKIGNANRGKKKSIETIAASLRTRRDKYGAKFSLETCQKYGI
jgi:group I intron endonuclease